MSLHRQAVSRATLEAGLASEPLYTPSADDQRPLTTASNTMTRDAPRRPRLILHLKPQKQTPSNI